MRLTPEGRARTTGRAADQPEEGESAAPSRALDPRESAFAAERLAAAPLFPSDVVIGSLRTTGLSRAEHAARNTALRLLRAAAADGAVDERLLLEPGPGVLYQLEELATARDDQASTVSSPIRVGRPQRLVTGETAVTFRIVREEQSWQGELVLEMVEGQWYISDIQATAAATASGSEYLPGVEDPGRGW